ncbi:acyl-CoA dehydrogenase [Streptomyces sp. NPDC047002]|uniref:acyl-CoA dehydrogenase family protein n=1 Tax=Streptomyces sp. NPDC047002 TaxID=3155475 RepID=UPI003453844A
MSTERGADAPPAAGPGIPRLIDVLFEGRFGELHEPWAKVFSRDEFRYREGLSTEKRSEIAYERLRAVNAEIDSVEEMVAATDRLTALHEWLGAVDGTLATLATIHYNLFIGSLLRLDPGGSVDRTPYTRLARYGTVLITELGYGNNAAALETTATHRPESDTFVLHTPSQAAAKFMPNTGRAGGPKSGLVAARLLAGGQDRGVFLFLVPLRDERGPLPGVRIRPLSESPGSAVDHCLTSFDRVVLGRAALLAGDHGELAADGGFRSPTGSRRRRFLRSVQRVTTGKLCLSAAALGGARSGLVIAVRHAHRRRTFAPGGRYDVPVFAHRCHQSRLLGATARAYAATFLLRAATRALTAAEDAEDDAADGTRAAGAEVLVAAAKGWITWQARDIAIECRERCGAQGLLSANRLADLILPIEGTVTAEGDNLVVWTKAGADMLTGRGYRPPLRPAPEGAGRGGPWGGPDRLLALLVHRELRCFAEARRRLGEPAADAFDRWNHAVEPALALVDAYATRRAAEAFLAAACAVTDEPTRDTLLLLFRLFALERLAPHTGPLLADGLLDAAAVHGLAAEADRAVAALAPHALALVEAFAVPDAVLQAPIALPDDGVPPGLRRG